MNKLSIITTIMVLLNFSCVHSQENKQAEKTILMQQETPYNQLEIKAIDKVILEKGTTQTIEIIKGSEYQDLLEINVVNNKLIINKKPSKNKQIYLKITYTNLNQLKLLNLGSVSCNNSITSTNLIIESQNTADVKLNIICDNLKLSCISSSKITLTGQSKTNEIDVENTANVNLDITCDNLKLTCLNSADLTLTGLSKNNEIEVKNTANLDFLTLNAEQMNLIAKNGASGRINISGKLSILLENYASFTVKGSPIFIKKEIKNVANFKM